MSADDNDPSSAPAASRAPADPAAPSAAGSDESSRRDDEVVARLRALGASDADLDRPADDLERLLLVWSLWPGERTHSLREVAAELGVPLDEVLELRLASGFAAPDPDLRLATEADLAFFRTCFALYEVVGRAEVMQMMRVIGGSSRRIADAVTSWFLVNIDMPSRPGDAQLSAMTTLDLIPPMVEILDNSVVTLVRKHLVAARRFDTRVDTIGGYEAQVLGIGFADLAGSTALAERLSLAAIETLLLDFETTATAVVTRLGGRVVKLIGDEVLFVAESAHLAALIGQAVSEAVTANPSLPDVRVGVDAGEVLTRDGDVFGPAVNRAARIVKAAAPGAVLVSPHVVEAVGEQATTEAAGAHALPGIADPVELSRLVAIEPVEAEGSTGDDLE